MNISSEKTDLKKTYLAIFTMLLAILCVDMYMVVIKFLGNEYTVTYYDACIRTREHLFCMYMSMSCVYGVIPPPSV